MLLFNEVHSNNHDYVGILYPTLRVTCHSSSYNEIPFYNNHIDASITTKPIATGISIGHWYIHRTQCISIIGHCHQMSVIFRSVNTIHLSLSFNLRDHGIHNL